MKEYKVITIKDTESYNITAYDNGDEIHHIGINENELLSLTENYDLNGYIRR